MNGTPERLLTPEQVGEMLQLKPDTIRAWAKKGKLPGVVRLTGARRGIVRFVEAEILRFIERRRRD